jgi:hypothetical protein
MLQLPSIPERKKGKCADDALRDSTQDFPSAYN